MFKERYWTASSPKSNETRPSGFMSTMSSSSPAAMSMYSTCAEINGVRSGRIQEGS